MAERLETTTEAQAMGKVIRCCGNDLVCHGFTNTCPVCGADYNWSGHRLAPREQWGEETGEHWSEVIHADLEEARE